MKRFLLSSVFVVLGFIILKSQNLVLNPGLEEWTNSTTPTGWTTFANVSQSISVVKSGSYCAKVTAGSSTRNLDQSIAVTAGKTYVITMWYYVESGDGTDARIWSFWRNGTTNIDDNVAELRLGGGTLYFNSKAEWQKYEVTVTAPAVATSLFLQVRTYSNSVVYWDDFSVVEQTPSGTITLTSPVAGTYQTGASFNFSWTSDGVTQVKFQVRPSGTTTWEDMEISPVDASLGTFPFEVPTSAIGGNYELRIVDANNPAVFSNSVTVTVEDKHFAGLSDNPFWPENSSVDVPVDLFANYMVLGFDEPVQFGAGSINLRKKSDNSLVYSYNASSNNWAFHSEWDGALILKIDADLLPNTGYYVTIDDDAIVDGANPANAYLGFSDNATWSFTTGEGNSIIPIAVVQAPDMNGNSTLAGNGFSYKTQGVVMFTHNSGYIIQDGTDEHSGLYVYQSNHGLEVGDYVQVIGKVTEFNKLTELTEVEYTKVVSKGNPLYAPVTLIGALTEAYESMLVNISNIECKSGFDTYNEFVVTNSEVDWTIDNWLYKLTPNPVVGDKYVSITGFVNDYNGLKIAPRSLSDFEKVTTAVEKVSVPSLFARLIKGELKVIASKPVASVNLYNIAGSTMMSTAAEGDTDDKGKEITIPVKKIAGAGIYVVEITYEDGTTEVVKVVAE